MRALEIATKPSACLHFGIPIRNSVASVAIKTENALNESYIFWDHIVYFSSLQNHLFINMSVQKIKV